jgi:hypothetical protein
VWLVKAFQVYTGHAVEQPRSRRIRGSRHPIGCAIVLESKGVRMKSSHQIHLEIIEQTLQPVSCFQLQAAKHKVLVIHDALADDKEYCEALLLKIDHLLGGTIVAPVIPSPTTAIALPASSKHARSVA